MKSFCASGNHKYFCLLWPSPLPKSPPEPIAYKLWAACQFPSWISCSGFKNENILCNLKSSANIKAVPARPTRIIPAIIVLVFNFIPLANITEAQSYITGLINEEDEENSSDDLNQLIDRKYKLQDICKRYGGSLESAIEYMKKLENDLAGMDNQDDMLASLEKEVEELHKEAKKSADVLNDARKKVSVEICNKTVKILEELELKSAKFEVKFKDNESLDYQAGISAEFYISTNAGFQTAPLATVASGGEVSRVMLALKEVFADYDNVGTMLFDEIDTGISGKAAQSVARKLKELSNKKQIIVITHLPVVAAMGDSHFHISKSDKDGISSTNILKLDKASKINIIATMISGEATPTALQQAEDMINRGSI